MTCGNVHNVRIAAVETATIEVAESLQFRRGKKVIFEMTDRRTRDEVAEIISFSQE